MAIFNVTNLNDDGPGSLRQAIINANVAIGHDSVTFADSLTGQTIFLSSGQLAITDSLTIDGDLNKDGTADITVQRETNAPSFRILSVDDGDNTIEQTVLLEGLIIANGRITFNSDDGGGGIRNHENLTIVNSLITGNSTVGLDVSYYYSPIPDVDGGGIWSNGTLTLRNSTVSNNSASGYYTDGGGIWSQGRLTIENSSISGNSTGPSEFANGGGDGGGIFNAGGIAEIKNSTISGNLAFGSYRGGGICNDNGDLIITNSTIDNNRIRGPRSRGGGIFQGTGGGNLFVISSTISNNYSTYNGGGIHNDSSATISNSTISGNSTYYLGGGINSFGSLKVRNTTITNNHSFRSNQGDGILVSGSIEMVSSIVAGNELEDVIIYSSNSFVSLGNNLIGAGKGIGFFNQPGDIVGITNPALEPLADNGGLTQTHALKAESLAIDAGSNPDKLATDQRGIGFSRLVNGQVDIGAFEVQPLASPIEIGLYDADSDMLITILEAGEEVLASIIAGRSLTIAAFVPTASPLFGQVESIFFDLNNGLITQAENVEPYALFGDIAGDYKGGLIPIGSNTINLDLYSQNQLQGDLLGTITRTFTIVDDISGESSNLSVGLFDADSDILITAIQDGDEILASTLAGRSLTIVAFVPDDSIFSDQVESMFFNFNSGQVTRIENVEPYALFGDNQGDYDGGSIPLGDNSISFDLYSQNNLQGNLLGIVTRNFTVIDDLV